MDCKLYFVLVALLQQELSHSDKVFVSGEVSDNVTLFHKTFPVPPSMRAIIRVDVSYPIQSFRQQGVYPAMRIYPTKDSMDGRKKCLELHQTPLFGSRNFDITNTPIDPKCQYWSSEDEMFHYTRKITIPYFKLSIFSFSFGFYCSNINPRRSLEGLVYNIVMRGTNRTRCLKLPANNPCYRYVQYALFPNFMLISNDQISRSLFMYRSWKYSSKNSSKCYQHMDELACYIFYPKCHPVSKQTVPPCKEMCHDASNACNLFEWANCDDLPSLEEDVSCTYKRVYCNSPPSLQYGIIISS